MKIIILQHIKIEDPGYIKDLMLSDNFNLTTIELDQGEKIPEDLSKFDGMFCMGGPMDTWMEKKYPWLIDEKKKIKEFVIDLKKPFLGFCLGCQLLGEVVGGKVIKSDPAEIGIMNIDFLKSKLTDADLIYHLAGVTDVAYVKKESNPEQDEKIKKIAIEGTNNILNSISQRNKIIFPSTHVIYEGLKETKKDIKEDEKPCPILSYSSSKVKNEEDIKKSNRNYVILRLGSVYGYSSTDTMRINIMPNLFSKIASQNGEISLFGGGKQIKSVVPLIDVVRCMKFMGDNEKIKKQTFNLVKETVTVKEVAEICKKHNPKVSIKI